ncbi:unnamed protein product, partial [Hapterophycus canaliculatus]
RFRVPCERCTTLAMCSNKNHPVQVKTLSELVQLPPGDGRDGGGEEDDDDSDDGGDGGSGGCPPEGIKEEAREHSESAGGEGDGAGAGAGAGAGLMPRQKGGKARKRVWDVEGERVMMPNMVSICDGVVLSLYLAPISIYSERRPDVPGDFAVDEEMGNMSRGGYHFARMPAVTIENILKLRALRDIISWKHNANKQVHRIVAAKVLNIWERYHPAESKLLDDLLHDGRSDKDLRFKV